MAETLDEMRDVLGNNTTLYETIPPQLNASEHFERNSPLKRTYEEEESSYVPGIPNLPMDTYVTIRPEMPRQYFSERHTSSLSNQQKQARMNSLRFGSMDARQRNVENAHTDTCGWLLHTAEYFKWLDTTTGNGTHWILTIKGRPGTGKSTLMKFISSHAQRYAEGIKTISFFFRSGGSYLESSITGAYRSLSVQLLEGNLALQDVFENPDISKPNGDQSSQWTIETLQILIEKIVRKCGPILCFIDAVDECPEDQARDMIRFFEHIHTVAESCGTKFQVCFSSRNLSQMPTNDGLELVLEDHQEHSQAIANHIENTLRIGTTKLAGSIRRRVHEISSGVFLWTVLVVGVLNKEFERNGIERLWQRLLDIPLSLDGIFKYLLSCSSDEHVQHLSIQLLLFARQPLSPEQLYFATRVFEKEFKWDIKEMSMDKIELFITEMSQGLIHITKDGFREVQFVHELARQFLMDHPTVMSVRPDIRDNLGARGKNEGLHWIVGGTPTDFKSRDTMRKVRKTAMASYLKPGKSGENVKSVRLDTRDNLGVQGKNEGLCWIVGSTPADFQSRDTMHKVRKSSMVSYLKTGKSKENAKSRAGSEGHDQVKLCCLEQIRIDIFSSLHIYKKRAEMSVEETKEHLERVRVAFPFMEYAVSNLLFHANAAESGGASQKGFLERFPLATWVRLNNLFEKSEMRRYSAEVSLMYVLGTCNMPDLIRACPNPGSGLEIEDERYGCAAFAAMATGNKEALEAILKRKYDGDYCVEFNQSDIGPDFQFSEDRTIFSYSAEFGFKGIVASLLKDDAIDIDRGDCLGRTPLMFAAQRGHEAVVKMLLGTGRVDITTKSHNGETALMLAAQRGHRSVAQMLVDTRKVDADVVLLVKDGKVPPVYRIRMLPLLSKRIAEICQSSYGTETNISTFGGDDDHGSLTNVKDKQTEFTDETYFSAGQIKTENSGILDWDDVGTVYSETSATSRSEEDIGISHMANDLFNSLFIEEPDVSEVVRIYDALPELLRTYAFEVGHASDTQMNRDAMVFVHRNRRRIAQHFYRAWFSGRYLGQESVGNAMSVQEKISRWNRKKEGAKDEKPESDLTPDESSSKRQTNHSKFQLNSNTHKTRILDTESKENEDSIRMTTSLSCSYFVTKTPAYELLLMRLRRELFLVPSEPNKMAVIRRRILELLPACNIVSRKTSVKAYTLRFLMGWDPLEFFEKQSYQGKPQELAEKVITLTGSALDAQVQTCAEYLSQTWPCTGKDIILLLRNVLGSEPEQRHECELLNGTRLTAWIQGSQFIFEAFGTAGSIAEVGEQFAWLGAALRSSPFESGVAYCTPCVLEIPNSSPEHGNTEHTIFSCTIQYIFDEEIVQTDNANGQCWQGLFRNPLIVNGYPIPRRPQNNTGLEISIPLMMALCQARTVTMFDGKPFIKGYCTMLVPTKHEEQVVTWHVITNEDDSHISYTDPRVQNITRDDSDSIRIFDVERSRHIIGWCASARSYAGAAEADYDIGWSGLETPYDGDRLLRKTITCKKLIASSGDFVLGLKDIPNRHLGDRYVKQLMWIAGKYIVLFDVKDGRAWMFDGASSLLHLVRASLRFSQQDDFSDQFLFKPHQFEEAPPTKIGKAAAIWVLMNEANKKIKLYESTECLKDRVEDILHILEQISSYQDKSEDSDIPPQQLEGFDFNAVAMVEERIKPRITELPASGRGWVDFTKAIHAMNLFGSGFGELIRPTENQTACSIWDEVPKGENHLVVSVSDIMRIQQREGSTKGGLLRLVDNIYWHKPEHIFEACLCVSENAEGHSDRIQMLIPRGNLGINDTTLQTPGSLAPDGAVIFGHNSQNLERLGNLRRSRSTSTHQSANLTCSDSGIGSSLDSLSATPANSQFEAVSGMSATSTRKRSSSTSMRGHVQGECSSAAGYMENKLRDGKMPALPQTGSCKRSKIDLPPKHRNHATKPTTRNHRFTIGWISPLPLEKEAARLVMDEEYPQEEVQYDNVYYLGGRIGKHDVVIGVPKNMGLSNAAILAAKMSAGFPDIKYFLVVGIAGGVPHYGTAGGISEIVLGDVVVSYPRRKHGGVLQYDKGAWKDSGRLDFHGHTNGIHRDLMAAINNFRAKGGFHNITQVLQQMRLKLDERRKNQYDDPGTTFDSLYTDTYEHRGTRFDDCKDCCDREQIISRAKRGKAAFRLPDTPFVHFGTIASSNQLQISVTERKRLQQEHEVLCFEMEAAGVMEEYPCMVIRGICDYADSHKNKGWQNYAAATAAAYAKGLLAEIPPMCCNESFQQAS